MKEINSSEEVDNLKTDTILMFSAPWCGPCNKLKPELEKLKFSHNNNNVNILYLNVDNEFDLTDELDICQIPTIYIHNPSCIDLSKKICSSKLDEVKLFLEKNEITVENIIDDIEFDEEGF